MMTAKKKEPPIFSIVTVLRLNMAARKSSVVYTNRPHRAGNMPSPKNTQNGIRPDMTMERPEMKKFFTKPVDQSTS